MGILNIRPVTHGGSKAVIAISGVSGSGKTRTALEIARGMVSKSEEIGFLDTENGRGSLYYDALDGKFQIADLYPPFSPSRYREAIKEFQEQGIKVLIIDSGSHEKEGEGGIDEIAAAPLLRGGKMENWKGAKSEHKKFVNTLLQADMHIIVCLRAREKMDFKNPSAPVSLGIQPICEKNFMYEMTVSIQMHNEGKEHENVKVPDALKYAFGVKGYLGREVGAAIIKWVDGAEKEDPRIKKLKSEMTMSCEMGMAGLIAYWNKLSKEDKHILKDHKEICKSAAEEYDKQEKDAASTPQELFKETNPQKVELP